MPLETQEDYALGNITANLCRYCVDEQGNLLDYRTILKNNVSYYVESQGITEQAALAMAESLLKTMPAWKNHS
jgi:hypothetical protein